MCVNTGGTSDTLSANTSPTPWMRWIASPELTRVNGVLDPPRVEDFSTDSSARHLLDQ